MPLLATFAGASARGLGFQAGGVLPFFELIATETLSGSQATISFTSIPSKYTHLQVRGHIRTDRAANAQDLFKMQFNSDTTETNYRYQYITGDGSTNTVVTNPTSAIGIASSATATAQIFAPFVVDILDYKNTNKNKTSYCISGTDQNGSGQIQHYVHLWKDNSAITTITFLPNLGSNLVQYTKISLYGLRG